MELKPPASSALSKPFRRLMTDEFLHKCNWDGTGGRLSIKKYVFFSKTLFGKNCYLLFYFNIYMCFFIDAWKTVSFGYNEYVNSIRKELTLSHDRYKKSKKKNE